MKLPACIPIVVTALAATGPAAKATGEGPDLAVKDLRCEYRKDPLGIDTLEPRLSWVIESERRGCTQSAYQVLVSSSRKLLDSDDGDVWDSGRISSDSSVQVGYNGRRLRARAEYFWKVRIWNQRWEVSDWSAPARWSMGLLEPADWKAEWIGCEIPLDEVSDTKYLPAPHFRRQFVLKGGIRRATLYATAAGVYVMYLNGQRVGRDCFTPGWTEYHKRIFYQTYDVTKLLNAGGGNVAAAILGDGWYGLHHGGRGELRLRAQLEVEYSDGSSDTIVTDDSWRTTFRGPILHSDMYNGESHDARKEMPGWKLHGFDDSAWQPVLAGDQEESTDRGTWSDVTDKVKQTVEGNKLAIIASNENFGDPVYGTVKSLRVRYRLGEKTETLSVSEGHTLEIAGREGEELEILKAEYGAEAPRADIASAVLEAHPGEPVRVREELKPVSVKEPKPGVFVYDMGQNFSGWARLRVSGPAGTRMTLRFAEMLNPDGTIYTKNLRGAKCTDTYVCRGGGREEVWEPLFTFHGFRYVELTGYPGEPGLDALTGVAVDSHCRLTGEFECSNPMLNKLFRNTVWGQRSNYLEVPTDCPQRDERLGWTGDAQVFIGSGAYIMDVAAFFTSWLITLNDSQRPDGGYTDFSPRSGGTSAGWGDAGIICPWTIWKRYGDTRILKRHYEGMAGWIEYCRKNSSDLLRPAEGYGDWLNVDAEMPKDVIATAYFAYSTKRMAEIAAAAGRVPDAVRYASLFREIAAAFNRAYVSADGHIKGDTQTTYLMALSFGLLPPEKRKAAAGLLIERIEERDWHLSTGFLGVNLLLPTLTEIGRLDVAYRLLQNDTYPSWLYSVKHGATTIWERWDGWTEEKGFQDPGMNSFNHYAYGSCVEWMFSTIAGIRTDSPGFERILIRPRPGGGIRFVKASYDSLRGRIESRWELEEGNFSLHVTIPANTTATVFVPASEPGAVTEGGRPTAEAPGVIYLRMEDGAAVYAVGSGTYEFESQREG